MFRGPVSPEFIISAGLSLVHPGPAIPHSTCLHGSRYIRASPLSHASPLARHMGAGCRGLCLLLGDLVRFTRGNLRPPRQFYPHQVGTLVELALPSHHSMIVAAPLYPPHEVTEPIQLDACGGIEMLFYVGHILEGAIFLDVPPLLLVLGEV